MQKKREDVATRHLPVGIPAGPSVAVRGVRWSSLPRVGVWTFLSVLSVALQWVRPVISRWHRPGQVGWDISGMFKLACIQLLRLAYLEVHTLFLDEFLFRWLST